MEVHCDVSHVPLSIITPFRLVSHEAGKAYAVWKPSDTAEIFETECILDSVPYTEHPAGTIGTFLPVDYR